MLKSKEARARSGTDGAETKGKKKKPGVPKQVVRRRPRTAKFLMQRAVGKVNTSNRLRVETMEDTVKSLGIPLRGPPQRGPDGKCGRRNPPVLGAASADPLDRRRATGFGKKIHALHYSDTSLRTDAYLSQSSSMLQRPLFMAYKKGFSSAKSQSHPEWSRPQSAAGDYTSGLSRSAGESSASASVVGCEHEPTAASGASGLAPTESRVRHELTVSEIGSWGKILGGDMTSFGSSSASSQSRPRPHTAGVIRRSVDSYVPPSTYTAVA